MPRESSRAPSPPCFRCTTLAQLLPADRASGSQYTSRSCRGTARASQKSENHRLRDIYATESWAESRTDISDWIFGLFEKAARGDAAMDASWPRVDRIEEAKAKLPRLRRLLESWLEKQRRTPIYTGNAAEE